MKTTHAALENSLPNSQSFSDKIGSLFLQHITPTPRGRAHILALVASTERNDEGRIFKALESRTDDEFLQTVSKKHSADETRHAELLDARIDATGNGVPQLPDFLNMVNQLDAALNGLMSKPIETREDVMRAYLLLQVVEERAISQLPLFIEGFREHDAESSDVFQVLLKDEERHLKYCHAISRRYAPNEKRRLETLNHFRKVEAQVFARGTMLNLKYVLSEQLLVVGWPAKWLWSALAFVSLLVRPSLFTPFAKEDETNENQGRAFERTEESDDHRERRMKLLKEKPEIRSLFGFDRRTIAVTIGVAVLQMALAAMIGFENLGLWSVLLLAYFPGAILSHWLGQSIHETSHRLAAKTKWANRILAWVANIPMAVPIAETFHRYHVVHHANLGVEGIDSDLPVPFEVKYLPRNPVSKFVWLALYPIVYFIRGALYSKGFNRAEKLNLLMMVAVNVAVFLTLGPMALAYLFLSMFFGHGLHPVAAHFIHEHYLFSGQQETYSYYGPLNHVTFNVGYHVEHHDFMNIPGWKLPQYRALTAPVYDQQVSHSSWTGVLVEFILRNDLGPWSRLVRTHSH
jgi:sphingolipid 4-desaturase/C4-monooxygenase